jgi:hypothetical protein
MRSIHLCRNEYGILEVKFEVFMMVSKSSRTWYHVGSQISTNVSEKPSSPILRIEKSGMEEAGSSEMTVHIHVNYPVSHSRNP